MNNPDPQDIAELRRVDAIYSEVLDLEPAARPARIATLCGGNVAMQASVEDLLAASAVSCDELDDVFEHLRDTYWRAVSEDEEVEDLSGQRIGVWRLTQIVGRGGLATVYEAQRADGEYSQRAAFKVMRRGLDTEDLVQRFRAEREILATLQQSSIAGILDGGALPDGRPYFVMEFVAGEIITDYVKSVQMARRGRVELIKDIGEALHHAHQHLFVHRDIKPGNVMVTDAGAIRLLDFGIAKVLDPTNAPLATQLTQVGLHLLTPAYASPEQLQSKPISTATDIYQLGLLMAELLTDLPPTKTPDKVPGPNLTGVRESDLIAIVQKATRLVPEDRYSTMVEFVTDLDRFLNNHPVLARKDSIFYRLGKFARRRPWVLPGVVGSILAVMIYVITVTAYSREVERERSIAEETKDFLISVFASPNPHAPADPTRGRRITVVEALEIGAERTLENLAGQPELRASLSRSISEVYAALDQFEAAIEMREFALEIEQQVYGPDSSQALASMRALAGLQRQTGDFVAAGTISKRQLTLASERASPGLELGLAQQEAGTQALAVGEDGVAAEHMQNAIDDLLKQFGGEGQLDPEAVQAIFDAAASGGTSAGVKQAEAMALAVFGADTPQGIYASIRVASSLTTLGDYAAAEEKYLSLLPRAIATFGALHPTTLTAKSNLGNLYVNSGRFEDAEMLFADLLPQHVETFGLVSHAVAVNYQNLATAISRQARYEEALGMHQRARELLQNVHGPDHYINALPLLSSAYIYILTQDPRALDTAREALTLIEASRPNTYMAGIAQCLVGKAELNVGNTSGATRVLQAQPLLQDIRVADVYARLCQPER